MSDRRLARLQRLRAARLYLVTDDRLPERELLEQLEQALLAGVRVVQFRAKDLSRRAFLERAARVQERCRRHGALFIVNDAADVAVTLEADGLHLGQDDLPAAVGRRLVGGDALIGLSISALDEARAAAPDAAVDYLGVGAMFPTATKPNAEYGGPDLLRAVRAEASLPLVAIGGISLENALSVWAAGADLLAVVSAVFGTPDPGGSARALLDSKP